ncbi:MAG: hydantoinase/oxoprolinase family protein [Gemmataceae bacterium]|nr:hypothetical protein [Gemmata sp.]MDW8198768.1 hydantoinase/oxoprolinase family protein [Gemmataceae bacterium]
MIPSTILGLDIGGANLKAATVSRQARSVPFPLWKQPEQLPAALAQLIASFPRAETFAITMTGELCDCFLTKRDGVATILAAVEAVAAGRPVGVWSTDGLFLTPGAAKQQPWKVAAANWHALARFVGRFAPHAGGLLLDIGSTTSDIIPLHHGLPASSGTTDWERLQRRELVYVGVRRTPICAIWTDHICAELFATTQDIYTILGLLPEEPDNRDTADGRPLTTAYALARLARMLGADREQLTDEHLRDFAVRVHTRLLHQLVEAARHVYYDPPGRPELKTVIIAGAGEFLARRVVEEAFPAVPPAAIVSLQQEWGATVSACAPAYAVAVLAAEQHRVAEATVR